MEEWEGDLPSNVESMKVVLQLSLLSFRDSSEGEGSFNERKKAKPKREKRR